MRMRVRVREGRGDVAERGEIEAGGEWTEF